MNVSLIVHSAEPVRVPMEVTLEDGTVAEATVAGLHVELVDAPGGAHGTSTLRFMGKQADAARELFVPGATVVATFAPAPAEGV